MGVILGRSQLVRICRLRVFENRVLWRIFGSKRGEVTGVEKTTNLGAVCSVFITKYYLGDKIENGVGGACSTYGKEWRFIQGFSGET
jgi:hypothetical protein